MTDNREPILSKGELPLLRGLRHWQWWLLVALNVFFLIAGQAAAVLLGRFYYDQGGNSKWMATLVQTAAFPILLMPFLFLSSSTKERQTSDSSSRPTFITLAALYIVIGILIAGDNMLYSIGLLYLAASTAQPILSSKFTALISNSVVILS
uniref:Uncharacterized protein n=1 Tax=Kalanchoe fedtschenkoi TaxID=63787 RepID=A0A7N0UJW8_KALFE